MIYTHKWGIFMYEVILKGKVAKKLNRLPENVQELFFRLQDDLESSGPIQALWSRYSKIGKDKYHCHLNYNYVACWRHEKKTIIIEVYYVGSRENAPY